MKRENIPFLLVYSRLSIGPIMILLSFYFGKSESLLVFILMFIGLLSDIFDGIIARKLEVATEKLRRADSNVDLVFWICTGIATYLMWPLVIMAKIEFIVLLFMLEGMCYTVSIIKFRKSPCTHSYMAKFWGIMLFFSLSYLIIFGEAGLLFSVCVAIGIIADIEVILITLTLEEWTYDIPSVYHAVKIRRGLEIKRYKLFNGLSRDRPEN